jgi:uncharacterized protein (TIGR03067 family)
MIRCLLSIAICALLTAAVVHGEDSGKEKAKLEGTWVGTSYKRGPGVVSKENVGTQLTIAKDAYESKGTYAISKKGSLKIDEAKGIIDFTSSEGFSKGKTFQGIYKLEGNVLTICYTQASDKRPTEFKSEQISTILITFEKK